MEITEQPLVETESTPQIDESNVETILTSGLKESEGTPKDTTQAGDSEAKDQPTEEQAALWAELLLEDEKKMGFKDQKELESFIERNRQVFEKSGHFMRQSDYTRKTQELAKQRQELETEKAKDSEFWGETRPDESSMSSLKDLWTVFNHGTPDLKEKINSFVTDCVLIANGKPPVGSLATKEATSNTVNPEIIQLRQEIAKMKAEHQKASKLSEAEQEQKAFQEATENWTSWVESKKAQNVTISKELEEAMVPYIEASNPKLDPAKRLDIAFKYACEELGLTENQAVNQVFKKSEDIKKKSGLPPTSKASANATPEPKSIEGILKAGLSKVG